ncbi:hypothetical protein KSF78_0002714 [Schistosoma japonicum]|nr:hypothetical protein KSF78_0002714 [Schistosoma japonicum]
MVAHRKVHEDICEAGKDTTRNHRIVCQKLINSDPSDISKFRVRFYVRAHNDQTSDKEEREQRQNDSGSIFGDIQCIWVRAVRWRPKEGYSNFVVNLY